MYWWQKFFDEHYLKVYEELEKRTSREVESIVRMMDLKSKAQILDLCCGYGRHSIELAQRGFKVTGYDLSDFFLQKAKKDSATLGLKIEFKKGDMRRLPFEDRFDAVVNIFTSFGFFDTEKDDLKVLKGVCKALRKKGLFLLDLINREQQIRNFQRRRWRPERDFTMLEDNFFDLFTSRLETTRTLLFQNGKRREYSISLRLYSFAEILNLLKKAGFVLESVYGDFDFTEYSLDSPRMILISRKT
ncbi:MAG: methyltransferase domain-containing protein [candidate division Zixibacteria bacterium]|nr:methyltransferase domain-containing protein [candidate division Zixibacteria bacterium]